MKRAVLVLSFIAGCCTPALAQQSVADFYKGKTVRIVVGVSVSAPATTSPRARCSAISASTFPAIRP